MGHFCVAIINCQSVSIQNTTIIVTIVSNVHSFTRTGPKMYVCISIVTEKEGGVPTTRVQNTGKYKYRYDFYEQRMVLNNHIVYFEK